MTHEIIHPKYGLLERVYVVNPPTPESAAALLRDACLRAAIPLPPPVSASESPKPITK